MPRGHARRFFAWVFDRVDASMDRRHVPGAAPQPEPRAARQPIVGSREWATRIGNFRSSFAPLDPML